eukprot:scaffold1060_cov246-Pinguiococcus_pyrenoidosus.AAC.9
MSRCCCQVSIDIRSVLGAKDRDSGVLPSVSVPRDSEDVFAGRLYDGAPFSRRRKKRVAFRKDFIE